MSAIRETWLPIPGSSGAYEVSDNGRIRSVARVVPHSYSGHLTLPGRILKPQRIASGHLVVYVKMDGRGRTRLVHRMVLLAFVGPCLEGMEACHWNGDPTDNRLANLRWDTRGANIRDSIRHGTNHQTAKTSCPWGHPLAPPNIVPSKERVGHRKCWACSLARNTAQHDKDRHQNVWTEKEIRAEADRRLDLISGAILDQMQAVR